uniref:Uncharacterized protein n=2 Tax=Ditylum brightwellii TaxID=49249 RepID=A0A6V2LKJ2_9STRA
MRSMMVVWIAVLAAITTNGVAAFTIPSAPSALSSVAAGKTVGEIQWRRTSLKNTEEETDESSDAPTTKMSLEDKMKSWEASEEEIKAASLGGLTAGSGGGVDGFDLGLWIMFPFMVVTCVLFGVFPFIMDKIDVSSVGPPPTI